MNHRPPADVAIILPAYNEGERLCQTLQALRETVKISCQVIVVNDASTDFCCDPLRRDPAPFDNLLLLDLPHHRGVAHARNLGASQASAPILVTMDAHCIPRRGWLEQLLQQLDEPDAGIVAPQISSIECPSATTFGLTIRDGELGVDWLHQQADKPYAVPVVGCACMVMTREFFENMGRFDAMRSYGMEDVEFCIRCWLAGYSVIMAPGAEVAHWFKKTPFPVNWHDYLYNRLRTAVLHFDGKPLERILRTLQGKPEFSEAVASLFMSDIWERRQLTRNNRKHDGAWFCEKFGIVL